MEKTNNTNNYCLPNVWGAGQLFAFSALDGIALHTNDFVGMLSGDKLGIRFYSKIIRELAILNTGGESLIYKAVTGDYISAINSNDEEIKIIYHNTHLIIGKIPMGAQSIVLVEGKGNIIESGNVEIQDTLDGDFTAIVIEGEKFAFAYGKTADEAKELCLKGIKEDIALAEEKKIDYYRKHSRPDLPKYSKLYSKLISVMKTQLYSPEKPFLKIWSTPERLPHKDLWLWDSVFHALGFRHINPALAEDLILDIFPNQLENGMIPHQSNITWHSKISQPPVIAWGAWQVYTKTGNVEFLKTVYEHNEKFLKWCYKYKKYDKDELFIWSTNEDKDNRCDESGIDNSPRFDEDVTLLAIDFPCYVANEMRYMSKIAKVLGKETNWFDSCFEKIKKAVNSNLWDEKAEFYYDYDITNDRFHKVDAFTSFMPLFAGICDEDKAEKLVKHLTNPEEFYTPFPIPSISKKDRTYKKDMWCGPVWINFNYMIICGLRDYGYTDLAHDLVNKTLDTINEWYLKTGVVFEFYDCENITPPYKLDRKGPVVEPYNIRIKYQSIRDFGWSNTLSLDMIASEF